MRWYKRPTTFAKLLTGFGLMALLVGFVGYLGNLPVVFCSGYDPETGQVKLLMDKGVRMVQKPFDPDVLLRTVREALDGQHLPEASPCRV